MTPPQDSLARAVDDFFEQVDAGEAPSPFEFADSVGSSFAAFLHAVEAKAALQAVIEPAPVVEPPRQLGPYTILRRLGRGGGGAVYEARDGRTGDRVALKLIHAALADQAIPLSRFEREGRLGARLDHAHLVQVYETGVAADQHYCAMQLVDGPTLKQRLKKGPLAPTHENLEQLAGIADGLAAVHAAGFVHRDVKPSNIMIAPDGRFLLGDFGLVRASLEQTITETGEAVGTIGYMSPEQFQGRWDDVDARADVYAMGATLYEVFCGRPAVDAGSIASMLLAAQAHAPPDPRSVRPELPPALGAVIMTAMERRPEDRYPTAAALRDDLRRLAGGRGALGQPVPPLRRWLRNRRGVALLLAALVLLLAGAGVRLATRPATIELESHPPAAVIVDGIAHGRTPLLLQLEPGTHEIALELDRFVPFRFRLELDRGPNAKRTHTLLPRDPLDRAALLDLARSLGYELKKFEAPTKRGGAFPLGRALLPAGRCRVEDLATLRFEASDEAPFPLPATLVVRRGDELLYERALTDVELVAEFSLPPAVLGRLRAGDRVVWGVATASGREFLTTCDIVAEAPEPRAALVPLPRELRAFFRAQEFLKQGLPMAALREAGGAPETLSLGTSLRALVALGADDSRLGDALREAVAALPAARRAEWFK